MRRRSVLAVALTACWLSGAVAAPEADTHAVAGAREAGRDAGRGDAERLGSRPEAARGRAGRGGAEARQYDYGRSATYESSDPKVATVSADGVVVPAGQRHGRGPRSASAGRSAEVAGDGGRLRGRAAGQLPQPGRADLHQGWAATRAAATARRRARTASSCRCSASTRSSITTPSSRRRAAGASSPPPPSRACCCSRRPAPCRTAAAGEIEPDSAEYDLLRRWIEQGTPAGSARRPLGRPRSSACPKLATVARPQAEQQVLVTAYLLRRHQPRRDPRGPVQEQRARHRHGRRRRPGPHRRRAPARPRSWPATWARSTSAGSPSRWPTPPATPLAELPQQNYIDELVQAKWKQAEPDAQPAGRRRHLPAPGVPRRHRHAADARRGPRVPRRHRSPNKRSELDRQDPRPQRVRRLLGGQVGRPAPQPAQGPEGAPARHLRLPRLDPQRLRDEHALRPVRPQHHRRPGDGRSAPAGDLVSHRPQPDAPDQRHRPALPRHADQLRPVPSPPVREVEPGRLLPAPGVLRPDGPQERRDRRRSRPSSSSPTARCRNPATGKIMQPRGLDGPEVDDRRGRGPAPEAGRLDGRARTTRSSPGPSATASGATSWAAAWSSRSTTCASPTRRATPSCSTRWPRTSSSTSSTSST